jgi:predicted GNAT family acetyltransferase
MAVMPDAVRDNPTLSRFELDANGVKAVANYTIAGNVITFTHTEVPPQARGGGTASRLIAGALQAARARGLSFRISWRRRHGRFTPPASRRSDCRRRRPRAPSCAPR